MLFVCENNLYAGHLDIAFRQPTDSTARIADAHGIPAAVVDGNNVIDVADAARTLIARARRSEGPGYLEAVTYRWRRHVGAGDTYEVRLRRPAKELAAWKRCDPIRRLEDAMVARGDISPDDLATLIEEIHDRVATIAGRIVEAPEIDPSTSEVTVHNADDH